MSKHKRKNIGSIISGTLRSEDLVPELLHELTQQTPVHTRHRKLIREVAECLEQEGYFESERCNEHINALIDALDDYAPPYFYFGTHPSDGADFGFWLSDSFEREFDGLKVSDLSEVPKGYSGEVLHINDHGNMTLYSYSRGKRREIWGIV